MNKAHDLPATVEELAACYERRQLSPVEVTRALLDGAQHTQQRLNAFITITAESALEQAHQAERRLTQGDRSPLLGIPITLKDLFDQQGVPTTAGSLLRREAVANEHAVVVRRLFVAGAISLGKTNLHEFAYGVTSTNPHYGPVHNPWNVRCVPGGSSGGAGASVAAGIGPIGMGTDTGGSIRIPAALCGVVGLKPTYGRVPKCGVFPLSVSLDHVGPLCRTVADAAATLEVISGLATADPTTVRWPVDRYRDAVAGADSLAGIRVGVIDQHMQHLHPDVGAAVEAAISVLSHLGAQVRRVTWPNLDLVPPTQRAIQSAESSAVHCATLRAHPEAYGEDVRLRLADGLAVPAVDYLAARETQQRIRQDIDQLLREIDALVGPTVPIPAPLIGQGMVAVDGTTTTVREQLTRFTWPYNLTGLPALSLPCGFTHDGMPIGMQIGARPFAEAVLLRIGHAYEQVTDWHTRRPAEQ